MSEKEKLIRLKKVARDMNKVMGLSPKIDLNADYDVILKGIKAETKELFQDDKFTGATWEFFEDDLGIVRTDLPFDAAGPGPGTPTKKPKKSLKKKPVKKTTKKAEKKKPVKKKATKKSSKKAAANSEKKTTKKKASAKPAKKKSAGKTDFSKSNKARVWKLWKNGKGIKDPEKLHKRVNEAVKVNTIRGWLSSWQKGSNLPAVAKQ